MIKKISLLFLLILSIQFISFAKPEKARVWIASYLRSKPKKSANIKANVIKVLKKNTEVKLLKFYKGWYYIEDPKGDKGWIYRKLVYPLDEHGNIIKNYNPYKDKSWKTTSKQKIAKKKTSKKQTNTPSLKKVEKEVPIVKKDNLKKLAISDSLVALGMRIDSVNNLIEDIQTKTLYNKEDIVKLKKSIDELTKQYNTLSEKIDTLAPSSSSNAILWLVIIIVVILVIIVAAQLFKNRKLLEQEQLEIKKTVSDLMKFVNLNLKKIIYNSNQNYTEIYNMLKFLELLEDENIKKILSELSKTKGDISKVKIDTLKTFKLPDIQKKLDLIGNIYTNFEDISSRVSKVEKIFKSKKEFTENFTKLGTPGFQPDKELTSWFKNFAGIINYFESMKKILIKKLESNKVNNFINLLKENFPSEASNFKLAVKNKKWKNALAYLEKLKVTEF